jgi:hypothetical protein
MSATIVKVIPKDGTGYSVNDSGATDIALHFQVQLSEPLGQGQLFTSFSDGTTSVPAIGSVHPARQGYYASNYEVKQPSGSAKNTLDVTVKYAPQSFVTEGGGGDPPEPEFVSLIEQWGWDDGTTQRELVTAVDGTPVLNSAKDPFDSVPQVETPSPTFTKVVRFAERKAGWFNYNCKVNDQTVTIGGISFPAGTLLCTICETIDIANFNWPFKYSVRLRYRTNEALIAGETANPEECGWDAVVCDAGMREVDTMTGQLKVIQVLSSETGEPVNVTSPELLNGAGQAVTRGSQSSPVTPYNMRFKAYKDTTFPGWFTSQPATALTPTT